MAKEKKAKRPRKNIQRKRKKWLIAVVCLVLAGLTAAVLYGLMHGFAIEKAATISPGKEAPDYDRLVGRWIRPDGGYVIEVNKIHPDGKVDAAYFNPQPIHVAKSTVSEKNGVIELFIELRGKGYPGSTYTLKYNPEHGVMVGIYYQAALQQSFDVIFQRK
jgi:hypothetical protein